MPLARRDFLAGCLAAPAALLRADEQNQEKLDLAFVFLADTHYLADRKDPSKLDPRSLDTNTRLVELLNKLPGMSIPERAGGGTVATPRAVLHGGDLIDSGDRAGGDYVKMQQTEWATYAADYGLSGKDGRIKYPVYEIHGNHDSPQGDGLVIKKIIERNKKRPGVDNVSKNGLHYSWDFGPVHFVALGIVVGSVPDVKRKRRYNPLDSLDFLVSDLKEKVGASGRPVILMHHVDVGRYSTKPDPDGPGGREWDPCDVRGYHDALKAYNVIAILHGHTHNRAVFNWDGTSVKSAKGGIPVFNVHKGAHFSDANQGIFYFHVGDGELTVRELRTADRWKNTTWTPQTWTSKFAMKKA